MKVLLSVLILACFFLSTSVLRAQDSKIDALQGLGEVEHHILESATIGQSYDIFVRLPTGYDESKSYPSLYLLDGGITFPLFSSYYHYMSFAEEVPEMIIVGISYGTDDWENGGNTRGHDYTAPSAERESYGGAEDFRNFLKEKVIPLVETSYAGDANRRLLFGQSLGGQFVLFTAMTQPDLFWGYIASNPALHRNLELFLQEAQSPSKTNQARLFVSSGEFDDPRFREPASTWMEHWTNKEGIPWVLETRTLSGQSHMSAAPEAFRQGVRWIFEME